MLGSLDPFSCSLRPASLLEFRSLNFKWSQTFTNGNRSHNYQSHLLIHLKYKMSQKWQILSLIAHTRKVAVSSLSSGIRKDNSWMYLRTASNFFMCCLCWFQVYFFCKVPPLQYYEELEFQTSFHCVPMGK